MADLYASALHLSRADIKALKMTDPYSLHRVVYSLFADQRSDTEKQGHTPSGIVYADQGGNFHGRKVLMLSDREPAPFVDEQFGQVVCKPIGREFLMHPQYRFKVQINPVRTDKRSGKRVPVKGRADIAAWFIARADRSWGFNVDPRTLQVDAVEVLQFKAKNERQITLAKAHIQGLLTVTDSEQFQQSFQQGIGKGRAFGCGLLQVVPFIDHPFA